ncbi:MAG: hypothetical protein LBC75_01215 [Fibromonadaceae bacterium]|jgi:signal transduction histidine kinase|nr:hypothetical protein [Fibromonadaceae bacterium]
MERILNLIFSADNVRMLVLLVFGFSGFVLMNSKMDRMESTINRRIDGVESSLSKQIDELRGEMNGRIDELKHNDIAHLNSAIEALTYALEKNGSLKHEDKEYVDSRLAH